MTSMYSLEDLGDLNGVPTLVRVDFNVPIAEGEVRDDTRIVAALPTLRELRQAGARSILVSHRGRPKGVPDPALSLRPVALRLAEILGEPVAFGEDCIGEPARRAVAELEPGGVCLLENLRFHPGEKKNDEAFARALAEPARAYVNDAFGTAHRAHASVVGVPRLVERRAAGRLMTREVETLGRLLAAPERPFALVAGGAKIGDKVETVRNLLPRLDLLILAGGMANTFLAAQGYDLADSLVETDKLDLALEILEAAAAGGVEILLPTDLVVTDDLAAPGRVETVDVSSVPAGTKAVDMGEVSRQAFIIAVAAARTVFWNGPLGVFEKPPFDAGTLALARALAAGDAFTVIGGGETVAAARQSGGIELFGHVSTGGGASLELLAGRVLPGVAVLEKS